ncbi:hypothetical protein GCM10025772_23630 [Ferrimonas gelatinilytica]|uniref:Uncharacterized protein n=1 Tax=Ferrimonas gelatinilytica TaxID=1255257 RepID=A0ABP9SBC3_9GAMM
MEPRWSPDGAPMEPRGWLVGRSSNGRKQWVLEGTAQSYGDWQEQQLESVA